MPSALLEVVPGTQMGWVGSVDYPSLEGCSYTRRTAVGRVTGG